MGILVELQAECTALRARAEKAEAERDALLEALKPSVETKAEYIGEFSFKVEYMDEEGEERLRKVTVPWTTTKDIMKAIRTRAGVASYRRNTSDVVSSETPETLHNGQHQPSGEE